jgi:hypothetical protein
MTTLKNMSDSLIGETNSASEPLVSFAWKQNSEEGVVLRSVTVPFKNLIQYLSFHPFAPAGPPSYPSFPPRIHSSVRINPSSLVPSSTRSSVKTPDTYPDPNHLSCHTNDITVLDPDPDPDLWLILDYSLVFDLLTHAHYSYAYWCSLSMLTDDPVAYWYLLRRLLMLTQLAYWLITDPLSPLGHSAYSAHSLTYISRPLGTLYP